jgi:hypothetical protein
MDEYRYEESCPANTVNAGRAKGCEGCPGQSTCLSAGGEDPGVFMFVMSQGITSTKTQNGYFS